jgi:hypothetical protein
MEKKDYNFAVYSENADYFSMKLTSEEYKVIEMFLEELNSSSKDVSVRLYDSKDIN